MMMENNRFRDYFAFPLGHPIAGSVADPHSLGYVYVIGFEEDQLVKIGSAGSTGWRLSQLQCGNPYHLQLRAVVSIYEGDPVHVEFAAHRLAKEHHYRGEWFKMTDEAAVETIIKAARNLKARFGSYAKAYYDTRVQTVDHEAAEEDRRRKMRMRLGME